MYIVTERLRLRSFVPSDENRIVEICNNEHISCYTNIPYPYDVTDARGWLVSIHHDNPAFAITLNSDNRLIGCISYTSDQRNSSVELGYWLDEEYWGLGYMTEAVNAIKDYIFKQGFHRIEARHRAPNVGSGLVLQKVGMLQEGVLKDAAKMKDVYTDLIVYGLINTSSW